MIISIHRAGLGVTSKETALEFYNGVRGCILIPFEDDTMIRVEQGNLIGFVPKADIKSGRAAFIPNVRDTDGSIAYRHRKYINAYLRSE